MRTNFSYIRANSTAEAVALLDQHGEGAMLWAGGTDMMLHWHREKVKPTVCIDILDVHELNYIRVEPEAIRIGAMTSLARLERSGDDHHVLASLSKITKLMATPQTRTLATVGGNICNASPAADLSPAFVALDAKIKIVGVSNSREISMFDFFKGVNKTDLNRSEVLQEVSIPLPTDGDVHVSYRRIDRTIVDIALVNASAAVTVDSEGIISRVGIGLGAVAPIILNAPDAASMLEGAALSEVTSNRIAEVAEVASKHSKPISDVRASKQYRKDMLKVMLRRTLTDTIILHGGLV